MESTKNALGIEVDEHIITNDQVIISSLYMASKLKQSLKPSNFENINNFVNSKKTDGIFDIPQIEYSFVTFFCQ